MNTGTVLVTGGTGFVGMRVVLQLLQQGYVVKTTLRNLNSKQRLISILKDNGITSFSNLLFTEAELTHDDNWLQAMQGCRYVLSVASPVFFDKPKNEEDAIRPACEGILRVLKFAKQAGVQRVVMTSNFGAVGFSQTDKSRETTEDDWTNTRLKGLSVYEKSKALAEKAAWDYINGEGQGLEFATINPVAILGPSLGGHVSGSFHLLQNLLNGKMKAIPNIPLNVVDVRDVADLHIRAMVTPGANGQRFIATANGQISLPQIAVLLKSSRPQVSGRVPEKVMPGWVLKLAAVFNHQAKEALVLIAMNRNVSNAKAKKILGWQPVATQEQTILEAVDSMVQYNLINNN
jgi:nucleoside-diphosphate-sugar epimerase